MDHFLTVENSELVLVLSDYRMAIKKRMLCMYISLED